MKKTLVSLVLLTAFVLSANVGMAATKKTATAKKTTTTTAVSTVYVPANRVDAVGAYILSKNDLPSVTFKVTDTTASNADIATTNVLYLTKTEIGYAGNDNELAAIIADELGAVINSSASKNTAFSNLTSAIAGNIKSTKAQNAALVLNNYSTSSMSTKQAQNADVTGVDLMVKAGYNPLAMIVVLGKMDGSVLETVTGQPSNIKRTMNIYDYVSYNYPTKLKAGYACKEYRNFISYIQPTITKRNSSKSELAKFRKQQAKLKKQRQRDLNTYKATGGTSGWDASYSILKSLMNSTETSTSK
ncbi:MAG: hypothetical protein LKG27_03505 [Clostridiaceae bacterium]|jgi:hypothetical protein|nr:hypothetical protein [Clostridiaceae bacterium]